MTKQSEESAATGDSFEALLREAARVSHVSERTVLATGKKLSGSRFEIVRSIGEGGMGIVYEAFDTERRSRVALKTLSRLDAGGIYRLKNEFRALADVSHPNLVQLHELFADDGQWFFTMDLIDGVRFDVWVRPDGALHEMRLRSALPELSSAVSAIHGAGKLHRDLKPSNVLVTSEGRVVVLDFGLAVDPELGGVGQTVADDSVSGTPAYMAPEQAAGKPATAASDFYALGVMLFEALTGKLPFEGRAGEMLAHKQLRPAPSATDYAPSAPEDLASLCAALLALDPASRPLGAALSEQLGVKSMSTASVATRSSRAPHAATDLVGRDAELSALRDAYRASCDGDKPVIVLLSGESGIGKSALLEHFLGELRDQGQAVVLTGRCYERESVPFKGFDALIDELSRYLRKQAAVDTANLMPREAYALRRLFPVLGRIDAFAQAPERTVGDPFELRRRGFLALGELFGLAIDDLQWSDLDSTTLFLHLVRQADAPRVLLIASHRSEGMQESPVLKPVYETLEVDIRLDLRRLDLGPLPTEVAALLVGSQLGDAASALLREAAGNPFLLRELSRAGRAAQGRSLAEILRARIAALPGAERALLEVLAVAARPLSLELAGEAAGVADRARAAFDALRSVQLARSAMQPASLECYHDKIRESVASGLGADTVRHHHGALAEALVRAKDADPEHLALHFEQAGKTKLAAEHAVHAADRAAASSAFDQAARLYEKALSLGAFDALEGHRLLAALADSLAQCGRGTEAADTYLRACAGAGEAEVLSLKGKAAAQYLLSGRLQRGRELLGEALRPFGMRLSKSPATAVATLTLERLSAPRSDSSDDLAAAFDVVMSLTGIDGLEGAALNLNILRRALDAGNARVAARTLQLEIWSRAIGIGDPRRARVLAEHAQAFIERLSDPFLQAWQQFFLGNLEYLAKPNGDFEGGLAGIEQFLAFARAQPKLISAHHRAVAGYHRAHLLTKLGRFGEVARELPALLDENWQRSDHFVIPLLMETPLLSWLAVGAQAEAEREHARATEAWSALANPFTYHDTMLHWGQIWLLQHRRDFRAAWLATLAHDERFRTSPASRFALFATFAQVVRGMTAAALAAQGAHASERAALVHQAEHVLPAWRVGSAWRRWLLLPKAAAACALRDRGRAVRLLRELDSGPRPAQFAPFHVHATRRHLGVLVGGDEGKALVTEADAFFRNGGVIDPEHFVGTLLPGFEIR